MRCTMILDELYLTLDEVTVILDEMYTCVSWSEVVRGEMVAVDRGMQLERLREAQVINAPLPIC